MVNFRLKTSRGQQESFPHNALKAIGDKFRVFAVQGFGRFSPFGPAKSISEVRYDRRQDWGALLWWPIVLLGLIQWTRMDENSFDRRRSHGHRTVDLGRHRVVGGGDLSADGLGPIPLADPGTERVAGRRRPLEPLGSAQGPDDAARKRIDMPSLWVFIILLGSYAFFWHSRDWNTASRLMLTYAVVDRGTVEITGLDVETGDKALFEGRTIPTSSPAILCWRPCRMPTPSGPSTSRPIRSTCPRHIGTGRRITGSRWDFGRIDGLDRALLGDPGRGTWDARDGRPP